MEEKDKQETGRGPLWNILQRIEGDKVILIIVLLLLLVSFLAIFSSTPLLPAQDDRLKTMTDHGIVALLGIGIMVVLYYMKIEWIKALAKWGFPLSAVMLGMLLMKVNIPGVIQTQTINGAVRNFMIAGLQVHVFEVVKVAMIVYLAWAITAVNEEARGEGKLRLTDFLVRNFKRLKFMEKPLWKRALYIYIPTIIVCIMVFFGSGSSAIFIGVVLMAVMIVGGVPKRELAMAVVALAVGFFSMVAIHKISGGEAIGRVGTMISRVNADYDMRRLNGLDKDSDEYRNIVDTLSQPVSAKIAVHEGGLFGKGIGNSTQKYKVQNIYGDYMYSFLVEEYGLFGGLVILILYVSLLARSSIIARMCNDEFARFTVGGLALLITGQAFMHMLVNVDIGPMTGQTLPLISHGASAFLVFCIAFGLIISISRTARKKIQTAEEMTQNNMNSLEENIEKASKAKE